MAGNNRKKYTGGRSNKDIRNSNSIYKKTKLPNGLTILSESIPGAESFAIGILVKSGTRHEPEQLTGLAHFMEHACFRHTTKRSARQIASQFESVGAYTNAYTTKEYTLFYARALSKHFRRTLNTISDIINNPVFKEKEIERERQVIIEEIRSYDDDPEELIFDMMDAKLYPGHPLGNPVTGFEESVKRIDGKALEQFRSEHYTPDNLIVSFAGNLANEYVEDKVAEIFEHLPPAPARPKVVPPILTPATASAETRPISQAHIVLARYTSPVDTSERYGLSVLNILFGDGMSSRLYQNLRERYGIAYSIYSSNLAFVDSGAFYIYAGTDKNRIGRTKKLIFNEIKRLREKGIKKSEFSRSKEQLKSGAIMELESMSVRMQNQARSELYFNYLEDIPTTIRRIDSLTLDECMYLVEKYFTDDEWHEVIIT